jgi:nucleotide-binding universal stress UspA family protein
MLVISSDEPHTADIRTMLRTFLVATRSSDLPPNLGQVLRRIAQLYRARLIFAQVRRPADLNKLDAHAPIPHETTAAGEPDENVRHIVLAGAFDEAICDKGHEADVIVIWHEFLRGPDGNLSADELSNVVRQAPRPIWLFREPISAPEHILVGYDGSAHSGRALHMAANLAETLGARLTVLNVDEARDQVAQELVLSRAAGYCEPYRITMERVGVFGRAAESIRAYVDTSRCDLLIVGAAGVGYLRGLLFGSVAGHLITTAPCSVVVAK